MSAVDLRAAHRTARRDGLAVGLATGAYGLSFGAIAVSAGLGVAQACALSLLVFTGASQFAFVGVVAGGGSPLAGAAAAVLLGTRNALYGLRLAPVLGVRGWRRATAAQLVIDESTAVALAQDTPPVQRTGFWATGLAVFGLWNLATLIGAVAGSELGDPRAWGLDAAVPAAFLALLWPRLTTAATRAVAGAAAFVALALLPVLPAGLPVLAAGAVAVLVGGVWRGGLR